MSVQPHEGGFLFESTKLPETSNVQKLHVADFTKRFAYYCLDAVTRVFHNHFEDVLEMVFVRSSAKNTVVSGTK